MPSFIKIGSGVLAPRGVEICHFTMLTAMAYIKGLGYRPTCDITGYFLNNNRLRRVGKNHDFF